MSLLLASSLFFGGALSYIVIAKFLNVKQNFKFTIKVTEQIITLLSLSSYSLAEALKMKYQALRDSEIDELELQKIMQIDKTIIHSWKMYFAKKVFPAYPPEFTKILPTFDWDGALRPLDDIYYNKECKTQEAQSNEQD
jgi:hypothetical protein